MATLATSDRNKPLLCDFIPQLLRALELRIDNHRAVRMAIVAISQLYFEPRCREAIQLCSGRLNQCLSTVISTFPENETELLNDAKGLQATLSMMEKRGLEQKKNVSGSSRFRRVAQAVLSSSKAAAASPAAPAPTVKHVMISYQWDSQPIAIEIEKRLSHAGIKTWFDMHDVSMGMVIDMQI